VEDDGGDDETDDRVGEFQPDRDDRGAGEDAEADEAVDARVLSIRDERRTLEPAAGSQPHLSGDLVTDEADHSGGSEQPEVREAARVNEALNRLPKGDQGADEDGEHDR